MTSTAINSMAIALSNYVEKLLSEFHLKYL